MEFLTDALTRLGGYFYFILIGAIEVIVAIVLIGILPARKKKEKKQTANFRSFQINKINVT